MAHPIRLGSEAGILLRILPEAAPRGRADLAEARFSLAVAGAPIWGAAAKAAHDSLASATPWPLVDFLRGLARIWPWLLLEEGYPVAITPLHPGTMMDVATSRWRDLAVGQAEAEEERLFDFRQRHDLSLLFRGLTLTPLWILREGHDALIWSPSLERPLRLAHRAVMADLDAIGEGLCGMLATSAEPRALRAKQRWDERAQRMTAQYLPIVTGLEMVELRAMLGDAQATAEEVYD